MLKKMGIRKTAVALFCVIGLSSCLKQNPDTPPVVTPPTDSNNVVIYDWNKIADSAQTSMNLFWSPSDKYYLQTNTATDWAQYWPNAHALDIAVDGYVRTSSATFKGRMSDLIAGVYAKNGNTWINYYYDDMEWMALANLRAYAATNDVAFKNVTDVLWADIKSGWSDALGGGIWWRKDNSSKNTPSNMPAAILAARLYEAFKNDDDLNWAKKIYAWEKSVLYESTTGLVYDNIASDGTKNTSWKFTYNQGTFIGAALELYKITNDVTYLNDAIKAADYTLNSGFYTSSGVLKDEGGGDGGLFKGVFIRHFNRLIIEGGVEAGKKTIYINFIKKCGETLWSKGTNKDYVLFGSAWDKAPGSSVDFTVQESGVMLLEALAELKKLNLVD
ncbi:glycosyl hydrolase family 76 [Ilyomonas limi]|uniref:Glycosyl hydrolase family 76 n=1 Tax=Ilyomonas limi TaxID=2575867 RepID=A0A4V5UX14_9BACT|nr:glycoside hydrolase family 76 protein [Ilyomonas limi]TKK71023.1 glycosyl hydrolase family 76 [Ilyomonas limi]